MLNKILLVLNKIKLPMIKAVFAQDGSPQNTI